VLAVQSHISESLITTREVYNKQYTNTNKILFSKTFTKNLSKQLLDFQHLILIFSESFQTPETENLVSSHTEYYGFQDRKLLYQSSFRGKSNQSMQGLKLYLSMLLLFQGTSDQCRVRDIIGSFSFSWKSCYLEWTVLYCICYDVKSRGESSCLDLVGVGSVHSLLGILVSKTPGTTCVSCQRGQRFNLTLGENDIMEACYSGIRNNQRLAWYGNGCLRRLYGVLC
jgi:hypothetical protein